MGLAVLGAAAAAPLVGGARAQAAGSVPAYADTDNYFTGVQTVTPHLGVARLDVGSAIRVDAHTMGLEMYHDTDWAGQTYDLINLVHKSTGDAIFIGHQGGKPPGFSGTTGGDSGLNVLIPYYLDDIATGRNGTVVNNRTGMRGVHIETQAVVNNSRAIDVQHFSNDYAMYMEVQPPHAPQPVGTGGAIYIDDFSPASTVYMNVKPPGGGQPTTAAIRIDDSSAVSSIRVDKWTAPASTDDAMLNLVAHTAAPVDAFSVRDGRHYMRFRLGSDGLMRVYDASGVRQMEVTPDGRMGLGSNAQFPGVQYQGWMNIAGVARSVALINRDGSPGSGTSIEFDDPNNTYALINATYDTRPPTVKSSSLSFQVLSGDKIVERLKVNGAGIGFFGTSPVAKPTVAGSRGGNAALASLISALASLGLVNDSSSA